MSGATPERDNHSEVREQTLDRSANNSRSVNGLNSGRRSYITPPAPRRNIRGSPSSEFENISNINQFFNDDDDEDRASTSRELENGSTARGRISSARRSVEGQGHDTPVVKDKRDRSNLRNVSCDQNLNFKYFSIAQASFKH